LVEDGCNRYNVAICAYSVMETHWHQAIWVRNGDDVTAVAKFLRWLSACHAIRFRVSTGTRGDGHVYQDRYKSKPVLSIEYYLTLTRYIEANPLQAGLVERAEHWPWSSLSERLSGRRRIISEGPVPLPSNWPDIVNARCPFDDFVMR
jgi:putative transposase